MKDYADDRLLIVPVLLCWEKLVGRPFEVLTSAALALQPGTTTEACGTWVMRAAVGLT
jgi:hypothetical protein